MDGGAAETGGVDAPATGGIMQDVGEHEGAARERACGS